ncbi:Dihydroneopterin triphosphate diphosphatase [Paraburkholderia ultramafica]|uniref:Dihydroneopterin triphosphate diphosphatase n=2 Tax=Paraburkholderia ultramafica TaxID=1544867 RepID=A0A6S7B6K1_9BURK|nr:Dihydroneopterin triphosphate diphosphatase [Paraburkholderia ultramafica]
MYRASVAPSFYTMPKPPKIPQSVLVIIHTPALGVLLIERADHAGFWQSVTGSKDQLDEPLIETAVREVAEETGIVIGGAWVPQSALFDWHYSIEYEIYPEFRHRYAEGVIHNTEHWFSVQVPEQIEVTLAPREHTAFLWLPYEEAASRCFSSSNADAILQLPRRLGRSAADRLSGERGR